VKIKGGITMNPVVGLDVAKEESRVQAFLDKSKPFGKSFSMKHTREALDCFIGFLNEIEVKTGGKCLWSF
jgi:transposase